MEAAVYGFVTVLNLKSVVGISAVEISDHVQYIRSSTCLVTHIFATCSHILLNNSNLIIEIRKRTLGIRNSSEI